MKKQIVLSALLIASVSYLAVPAYSQIRPRPPGDGRPGDGRGGDGRRGEGRPGDGRPGRPGDGRPGGPGHGRPGDGRPGHGRPNPGFPFPGRPGEGRPWPAPAPDYRDSVFVSSVTRATGGEWFRVSFRNPVVLRYFDVTVVAAGVRLHEVKVHTWSGRSFYVPQMSPSPVFYSPSSVGASYFNGEAVRAIDIRAEAMGGYADLVIQATGDYDTPRMDVSRF